MEQKNLGIVFWLSVLLAVVFLVYFTIQCVVNFSANKILNAMVMNQVTLHHDGSLSITVLPSLSVRGVNLVVDDPATGQPLLAVKNFYIKVSLMPLFHHRMVVEKIELNDANILIVKKQSGETNWDVVQSKLDSDTPPLKAFSDDGHLKSSTPMHKANFIIQSVVITNAHVTYRDLAKNTVMQLQLDKFSVDNGPKKISIIGPVGSWNDSPFNFNFTIGSLTRENTYPFSAHTDYDGMGGDIKGVYSLAVDTLMADLSIHLAAGDLGGNFIFDNKKLVLALHLRSASLNIDKLIPDSEKIMNTKHDKSFWDIKDLHYISSNSSFGNSSYLFLQSLIAMMQADVDFQANQIVYRGKVENDVVFTARSLKGDLTMDPCLPDWLSGLGDRWFPEASFKTITSVGASMPGWCS
jgi:hypothetical protein